MSTWPSPDRFDPQPTLAGELVRVRPLREADYDALYAVASDPLIWEQHPDHDRHEPEVFRRFFAEAMERGGALAVLDVVSGEMLGSSRYHGWDGDRSEVEIGWTFLARKCWGGRYNAELKRLMMDHAFRFVDHVLFVIGPENRRSRRAVEKIGGTLAGMIATERGDRCVYRIPAPRGAAKADSPAAGDGVTPATGEPATRGVS